MKRLFDLMLAAVAACFLLVLVLIVAALVRLTSKGPTLYWSDRVGRNNFVADLRQGAEAGRGVALINPARSHGQISMP